MKQTYSKIFCEILLLTLIMSLTGCGGVGTGGGKAGKGGGSSTTTISGKVSLSSTVGSSKPSYASAPSALLNKPQAKIGTKAYHEYMKSASAQMLQPSIFQAATWLDNAKVYLFSADNPDWLYPVAETNTDSSGNYTLSAMKNAVRNNNSYTDGSSIPAGNYTIMAVKDATVAGEKPMVAVHAIVKKFDGTVSNLNLTALPSDVLPAVRTMFGVKRNTDGTQTWGGDTTTLPINAAIQVSFSMPVLRESLSSGITISPQLSGKWTLSADWLTATFYPSSNLAPGTTYAVTVNGSDLSNSPVLNVYKNPLNLTGVGTFTTTSAIDTRKPTAMWRSPSIVEMNSDVDVTIPVKIASNEPLDVNGLFLDASPSLGDKPGVMFVGKDQATGVYVYEFLLGEPLILNQTYNFTVTGGKDMAGNPMNDLTGSITTVVKSDGIDSSAGLDIRNAQAAAKNGFGKWVRAMNDRNLAQLQNLMSGDFYMEYDMSKGASSDDINRDGRFSNKEFINMMQDSVFPGWDYCGTTITGTVTTKDINGNDIFINVYDNDPYVPGYDTADFEFRLSATSAIKSSTCGEMAPQAAMYATLHKINGAWVIVRASEGIDTRNKELTYPNIMAIRLYENGGEIADGGTISTGFISNPPSSVLKFEWDAVSGASSYVFVLVDMRNPRNGLAFALPSNVLSISTDSSIRALGGVEVFNQFGFETDGELRLVPGGEYSWEVIALGTTLTSTIENKQASDIFKDIIAVSNLHLFKIDGVYRELSVSVSSVSGSTKTLLPYSEMYDGYDAGIAPKAEITVTYPDAGYNGSGTLYVDGSSHKEYAVNFSNSVAVVPIDLYMGWNRVGINDNASQFPLYKDFNIQTTGGIPPVILVKTVTDDVSQVPLVGDMWGSYTASSGAKKITVSGAVSDASVTKLIINLWNKNGPYSRNLVDVTSKTFTAEIEIYSGDNWIEIADENWQNRAHIGVYTDTGSLWVPPIEITGVTTATKTADYSNSADWDASADTDDMITITGKFKTPSNGSFWTSSDGANSSGTLYVGTDGSFVLNIELYNGWNYVSMNDSANNWYGVNIYTSNGKTVIKPTITTINGAAYTPPSDGQTGTATVSQCYATVSGTALTGKVHVNWNGSDGTNNHYETMEVPSQGVEGAAGNFSATLPLLGGTGSHNNIDVYDANWKWTGVTVNTTGSCPYSQPQTTIMAVKDGSGNTLTPDTYGNYNAGSSQTISLTGTTNRAGRTISASLWACGKNETYYAVASTIQSGGAYSWSFSGIKVYDGNYSLTISDGYSSNYIYINASNGTQPTPPIVITSVGMATTAAYENCGSSSWDVGGATSLDINGKTVAPDGTGTYVDPSGASQTVDISGGNFTIKGVNLYEGYNQVNFYDTDWNYHSIQINTTNGVPRPRFVVIESPAHNATGITGSQTVTGKFYDPTGSGFAPNYAYAYVYNAQSGESAYYSTDLYQLEQNLDWKPLTLNGSSFSFDAYFGSDSSYYTYIYVYAADNSKGINHSQTIYVNNVWNYNETWTKPVTKRSTKQPLPEIIQQLEAIKPVLMYDSKSSY